MTEEFSDRNKICGRFRRRVPSCPCKCDRVMAAFKGVWTKGFWRAVSGEFLAMLIFVLLSLGSTINWAATTKDSTHPPDLVLISLCFGLSIATLVQCFSQISGAHINPAVTVAMVVTRKLSLAKGIFYLGAQCLGAMVGAAILYGVTPPAVRGNLGVTSVSAHISSGHALVVELFITFELVFTIFATCDPKRTDLKGSAALAIGLSVCIGHLFAIPYTGASMNPARSFGPAVITGHWENHWVYWLGPLMGGVLAAALYEYLFCPDPDLKRHYASIISRTSFPTAQYKGMEPGTFSSDQTQLMIKQPAFTVFDVERAERKERETAGEVLSSV
ncbi:aquaporin-4 [Ictalurus furcatus]|uniref:aquaporin-4 n=1 Tax=Ictalurus furcatus TaxID=66913 RepID=UPI00234FB62A|nr:aquaporin-4 [Ictalurus furcatus]